MAVKLDTGIQKLSLHSPDKQQDPLLLQQDKTGQAVEQTFSQGSLTSASKAPIGEKLKTVLNDLKAQLEKYDPQSEPSINAVISQSQIFLDLNLELLTINALDRLQVRISCGSILRFFRTCSEKEGHPSCIAGTSYICIKRKLMSILRHIDTHYPKSVQDKEEKKLATGIATPKPDDPKKSSFETDNTKIEAEFIKLDMKGNLKDPPCNTATAHRRRNRYINVLPYDHSLFTFKPEGQTDPSYYNASVISSRAIAAQGPKADEHQEFWDMILASQSSIIVMLTNLSELGKEKCTQYWPEKGKSMALKNMVITCRDAFVLHYKSDGKERLIERIFEIKDGNGKLLRIVSHYQLFNWFDYAAVHSQTLIDLVDLTKAKGPNNHLVVHCSAGIGRSGTFLAISNAYDALAQGETPEKVSIPTIVTELRQKRMGMVQTLPQYALIYEVCNQLYGEFQQLKNI